METIDKVLKENKHFPVDPTAPDTNVNLKRPGILEFSMIVILIILTLFTVSLSVYIIFEKYL
ncbi:MAG: hypothetical protein HGGPFJEG_02122 [Ignavibacteria bacterium]|nr:hypothetical protein [Ignavibacteria bacterium]